MARIYRFKWLGSLGVLAGLGFASHWLALAVVLIVPLWADIYIHYRRDRRYRYQPFRLTRAVFRLLFLPRAVERYARLPEDKRASSYIPQAVKQAVDIRDGGKCQCSGCPRCVFSLAGRCAYAGMMCYDHFIPRARGGASTVKNVRHMCPPCNRYKSDTMPAHIKVR